MGTQAVVARATEGGGFAGRIVLHDGEPGTAASLLRSLVHHVCGGDVEAATRLLIDEHPGGWVDIPDADSDGTCLCHDAPPLNGPATTELATHETSGHTEFVYVLYPDRLQILVLGSDGWEEIRSISWAY
ncbi:hypothetical protein GCM10014715_39080 [Streptomyces spiralis]|uniref:Uncharacterized protein n=1 Tax=Streptomyces spiralis TaxID=66376 RepID=A0A918ZZ76_9ACTN|nr:hypothetical protein [Streptomyces spiralis]GHE79924.1 hypothetical protein GCM10014715_39080 [Streptomyces spiralis]